MVPSKSSKHHITTSFAYAQDNYPRTYNTLLFLIFLALGTVLTTTLINHFPQGLHLYLILLTLNLFISSILITFIAHLFSSHPSFCTPLALIPVLAINIPFSIISFPDFVGPVLYFLALALSAGVMVVGMLLFVRECVGGWKPTDEWDNPWLGDCT